MGNRICMGCAEEFCSLGRLWCRKCLLGDIKDVPRGFSIRPESELWIACYRGEPIVWANQTAAFPTQRRAVIFCRGEYGRQNRAQTFREQWAEQSA